MKITKKQTIGENLLYVMVWSAIILVPVLNSLMMSELHVSWENVLIAWRKIAPYLIIFIVHNSVIAPRFMLKHKYWKYLITNLTLIIGTFWFVDFYEQHITDSHALLGPLRRPVHRAPQGVVHRSGNVLERDFGIFHVGGQYGHRAHCTSRYATNSRWRWLKRQNIAGRNGLSEVPDQSPLLHEHAQQHPCADRHRHGICKKRRDRAFEDDALRALRFGTRNHLARTRTFSSSRITSG